MAAGHSKLTVIKVGTNDLSAFCNTSEFPRSAEAGDTTGYGSNSKTYGGGLKDATFTMGGTYDDAASGTPAVVLGGHESETLSLTRQPQGTGTGKPQQKFDAVLTRYVESAPVAGFIAWTADFQCTGDIDDTAQV